MSMMQLVLASMPIYYMSFFKLPGRVADLLEKMMREFLWDTGENGRGRSLVAWDLVVRSKDTGGLGLGNLKKKNLALLGKWLWRFPWEQQSLWARVIKSKNMGCKTMVGTQKWLQMGLSVTHGSSLNT